MRTTCVPGISAVLGAIESLIKEAEKRVANLAEPISGKRFERVGFVDGSYTLDERRGAYLLALSVASLIVDGEKIEGVLKGSRKLTRRIDLKKITEEEVEDRLVLR